MVARCRAGLENLLAAELHDAGLPPSRLGPGVVLVTLDRPLHALLSARTLLTAGALVPLDPRPRGAPLDGAAIAAALADPDVLAVLAAWTRGPIRWRLDFERGGHRRALVWDAAARARDLAPALRNQPRATTWDIVVTADEQHLELRPRRFDDDRFPWRKADVPAASHPTVAAALARIGGAVAGEHVWDPFVGSGAELCERGRLGPARLHGTDLDARALAATRTNLDAAGLTATLTVADALTHTPPPLGLIITNPPLGRRLRGDAASLLEDFAARVPRLLARGGRLAWITPSSERTAAVLRRGGLILTYARDVDLGGYEVRLERWGR
jgi:23S rRNA G2445 N2-methylase RlmL